MLDNLSKVQEEAVKYNEGPTLIFAGAGSGKTRVLTHKIAYIIANNIVRPENILAVTFTNKAADEMQERVKELIGPPGSKINIGTFHSICAQILRNEIHHLEYSQNFTIYDSTDQKKLLKDIIDKNNIDKEGFSVRALLSKISNLKSEGTSPAEFEPIEHNNYEELVDILYPLYQKNLKKSNAVDFDDLLILPLRVFDKHPEVLNKYQTLYQYILVDEYQDTNPVQFQLIKKLGNRHQNVCVVGDDDQSIYSWRGADITNILSFESSFEDPQVFKLEQNYRSTQTIVEAASAVVQNNEERADKELWSEGKEGEKITLINTNDEYDEARQIAQKIQSEIYKDDDRKYKDITILYRTNAQSRVLEKILNRYKIPNEIIGGVRFYERAEIKDILAYLKVFANPKDDISLKRIINKPRRGIGKKTFGPLEDYATKKGIPIFKGLSELDLIDIHTRGKKQLHKFHKNMKRYQKLRQEMELDEWVNTVIEGVGLREHLRKYKSEKAQQKLANLDELVNAISDYCSTETDPSLEGFLEEVSLVADIDNWEKERNRVSMMTLHSAKGLEFPIVFIAGLNESLLPVGYDQSEEDLAEERRLFYVGLTRAEEKAFLTTAKKRNIRGEEKYMGPSRFLKELPNTHLKTLGGGLNYSSSDQSFDKDSSSSQKQTKSRSKNKSTSSKTSQKDGDSSSSTLDYSNLETGTKVTHKIFGKGRIVKITGFGKNSKLTIDFDTQGRKTIIAKYVNPV